MSLRRLSVNALAAAAQVLVVTLSLAALYWLMVEHLGVALVGVWSLAMSVASVGRLGEAGLGTATMRFVSRDLARGDAGAPADTAASAVALVALGTGALALAARPLLERLLGALIDAPAELALALEVLPYALFVMVAMAIAQVLFGLIDAFQRTWLRAALTAVAALVQVSLAFAVLPARGLVGLALVQCVHAALTVALAAAVVLVLLRGRGRPRPLSRGALVELLRFGGGLQASTLAQLLFEPVTKALLTAFGGLAATGTFEVVNRAVVQLKSLVVAAFQMLVPYVAGRYASAPEASGASDAHALAAAAAPLARAGTLALGIVAVFLPASLVALPLGFGLWLGPGAPTVGAIAWLCALGWSANLVTVPAYMFALAFGRVRWTLECHAVIGLSSAALGTLGGLVAGGTGVVAGAMTALALGSFSVPWRWRRALEGLPRRAPSPSRAPATVATLALLCLNLAIASSATVPAALAGPAAPPSVLPGALALAAILACGAAALALAWRRRAFVPRVA